MTKLKLFHVVEKSLPYSTNFRDKLPFVNLTKSFIFDLSKILLLKRLILTYCLIAKVMHCQIPFTELLLVFKLCPVLFGQSFSKLSSGCPSEWKSESP